MTTLDQKMIQDLINLLSPLVLDPDERPAVLSQALGADHPLMVQLDFSGAASTFVANAAPLLNTYGEADGRTALDRLRTFAAARRGINAPPPPRVFISYARKDGEAFAAGMREALLAAGIPLWQDRVGMEGGRDWWGQITDAIDQVQFMILIMTPAAMESEIVRKEWRYARAQGVCVYPVKGAMGLDFASLPRWMRDAHFYDLGVDPATLIAGAEWAKFTRDLAAPCETPRVPFPYDKEKYSGFVPRPTEFEALITLLLDESRESPKAITAALRGAGGYGKTTLARALIHDERIQIAYDDGILWVELGEAVDDARLLAKMNDVIEALSGKRNEAATLERGKERFAELLADRDILIVIDDAWRKKDVDPFLVGGGRCTRLITTRNSDTLPRGAQHLPVDAMKPNEAVVLLAAGLPDGEEGALANLARRLGEWALLLALANGVLHERIGRGETLAEALDYADKALTKRGLAAFDARDAGSRNDAVKVTLGVSLSLLKAAETGRFSELAIFPEDTDIPLETVGRLWAATGNLDEFDTEELCGLLYSRSLLQSLDLGRRVIRLHDVVRTYLSDEHTNALKGWHNQFLGAYKLSEWWQLSHSEPYLWETLAYHLLEAGRREDFFRTAADLRYIAIKTLLQGTLKTEGLLLSAIQQGESDPAHKLPPILRTLTNRYQTSAHMLERCSTLNEVGATLLVRILGGDGQAALESFIPTPYITAIESLPDLPHPSLIRTLTGHGSGVTGCLFTPDGNEIVSSSYDGTLKIWHIESGAVRLTLRGHSDSVRACAISANGTLILSASNDGTLKLWDRHTGEERQTLSGHDSRVTCCSLSADGKTALSGSEDKTLKIWDVASGRVRFTLEGHTENIWGCALTADGKRAASASADGRLIVWDALSGQPLQTIIANEVGVTGCAWGHNDQALLAALVDKTVGVWDALSGESEMTYIGHEGWVNACAWMGPYPISASADKHVVVWDINSRRQLEILSGHTGGVNACAAYENYIVSASVDRTLKLWEIPVSVFTTHPDSHAEALYEEKPIRSLAVNLSPTAKTLVVTSQGDLLNRYESSSTAAEILEDRGQVDRLIFSPDGQHLLGLNELGRTLTIWETNTWQPIKTIGSFGASLYDAAISRDGTLIATASSSARIYRFGQNVPLIKFRETGHIMRSVAFSPDGQQLISGAADASLTIWEVATGNALHTIRRHAKVVRCLTYSPDGRFILSGDVIGTIYRWDARSGNAYGGVSAHDGVINRIVFSPDGRHILTCAIDGVLKVWDATLTTLIAAFYADGAIYDAAWLPDGERIVAGGERGLYWLKVVW
ncbi:MAG TPA: NB-ARC domain-containing protein [Aggregatilineales bacterium]|nr:TIR domain-containing protein [Anaerolineales bacterium]HRE46862.1 NB-ARC domain-containing protein [Aggregatilineales bacterium]